MREKEKKVLNSIEQRNNSLLEKSLNSVGEVQTCIILSSSGLHGRERAAGRETFNGGVGATVHLRTQDNLCAQVVET